MCSMHAVFPTVASSPCGIPHARCHANTKLLTPAAGRALNIAACVMLVLRLLPGRPPQITVVQLQGLDLSSWKLLLDALDRAAWVADLCHCMWTERLLRRSWQLHNSNQANLWRRSGFLLAMNTLPLRAAIARAVSNPMPTLPPVTCSQADRNAQIHRPTWLAQSGC